MATIDLIVLGMLKKEALSAYDLQKLVDYRHISKWVKISTPSIYKKVLQLEERGYVQSRPVREGKMPEKAVYSLTKSGEKEFERLMRQISSEPIHIFLDFNAVIVNLDNLPPNMQKACLDDIEKNVQELKACIQENIALKKDAAEIPETGMAVLRQQCALAEAIAEWIKEARGGLAAP